MVRIKVSSKSNPPEESTTKTATAANNFGSDLTLHIIFVNLLTRLHHAQPTDHDTCSKQIHYTYTMNDIKWCYRQRPPLTLQTILAPSYRLIKLFSWAQINGGSNATSQQSKDIKICVLKSFDSCFAASCSRTLHRNKFSLVCFRHFNVF